MSEVNWELIVHRLDTIVKGQDGFNKKLEDIDGKLAKIETINRSVEVLDKWKDNVEKVLPVNEMKGITEWKGKLDDVVSPTQLKDYIKDINNLKIFKAKSTMIWAVIQGIVFVLIFLDKLINIF